MLLANSPCCPPSLIASSRGLLTLRGRCWKLSRLHTRSNPAGIGSLAASLHAKLMFGRSANVDLCFAMSAHVTCGTMAALSEASRADQPPVWGQGAGTCGNPFSPTAPYLPPLAFPSLESVQPPTAPGTHHATTGCVQHGFDVSAADKQLGQLLADVRCMRKGQQGRLTGGRCHFFGGGGEAAVGHAGCCGLQQGASMGPCRCLDPPV